MNKNTYIIPTGLYCYSFYNGKRYPCPYWSIDKNHEYQENGFCSYLNKGDWDFKYFGLLWDQCKECDINK